MSELQGIARFTFHEGKVEEYKRLSAQAMDIVRAKESGTLEYAIYFNEDESGGPRDRAVRELRGADRARSLLPHVEDGTITLVSSTTENPYSAQLSPVGIV